MMKNFLKRSLALCVVLAGMSYTDGKAVSDGFLKDLEASKRFLNVYSADQNSADQKFLGTVNIKEFKRKGGKPCKCIIFQAKEGESLFIGPALGECVVLSLDQDLCLKEIGTVTSDDKAETLSFNHKDKDSKSNGYLDIGNDYITFYNRLAKEVWTAIPANKDTPIKSLSEEAWDMYCLAIED